MPVKMNTATFLQKVNEKWNNEFEYIPGHEYIDSHTEMTLFHTMCGLPITKSCPKNFYRSYCTTPECSSRLREETNLKKYGKRNVSEVEEFKDKRRKTTEKRFGSHNMQTNIPKELIEVRYSKEKFRELCIKLDKPTPTELQNYFGYKTAHVILKLIHEYECEDVVSLNISHGERQIDKFLKKLQINFEREKSFPNLRSKKGGVLRYDFYLIDLKACIEYDGLHHFKDCGKYVDQLQDYQERDAIKNNFCKANNIHLLRIPYWNVNDIEDIILCFIKDIENK